MLVFALSAWLLPLGAAMVYVGWNSALPAPPLSVLASAVGLVCASCVLVLALGAGVFHLTSRALGGTAELRASVRAAAYLQAYVPIGFLALAMLSGPIRALGPPVSASPAPFWSGAVVVLALGARGAFAFARSAHGLSAARGAVAVALALTCLAAFAYSVPFVVARHVVAVVR